MSFPFSFIKLNDCSGKVIIFFLYKNQVSDIYHTCSDQISQRSTSSTYIYHLPSPSSEDVLFFFSFFTYQKEESLSKKTFKRFDDESRL